MALSGHDLFGIFHICAVIVSVLAAVIAAKRAAGFVVDPGRWASKDAWLVKILQITGFVLAALEIFKQLYLHFTSGSGAYDWWYFPFQLCSVPMYLCLFCAFCKNEKINSWLYEFMFSVNMFGGIMAFLEPSGIQHPIITLTAHAYLWHMTLIFLGLYLYLSKRVCNDHRSYFKGIIVYYIACAVAQSFNLIYGDKVNCFYISPYVQSPLAVFKDIYAACGWFVNMFLLMLGITLASGAVYYIGYYFRVKAKKKEKVSV
jgi:hypothetical protein